MKSRTAILSGIVICILIFVTYRFGLEKSLVDFKDAALRSLPKILTASLLVVLGQIVVRLIKPTLSKILGRFEQREAITAMIGLIEPVRQYREILKRANLDHNISDAPEIYLTFTDSWVSLHLRYLVSARGKRKVRSSILEGIFMFFSRPENVGRIKPVYPRVQSQRIGLKGMPIEE
jgi:hypothetical protein